MLNNFVKPQKTRNENSQNPQYTSNSHNNPSGSNHNFNNSKTKTFQNLSNDQHLSIELSGTTDEILNLIKADLDSIDSESMLENLVKILNSIQEDIVKKFENSKYLTKIQEIFEKNFETIINYFIRCLQHCDTVKNSVGENLAKSLIQLNQIVQSEVDELLKNKISEKRENNLINNNIGNSGFVFDEEFVTLINSLSSSIKEFMRNTKACVKTLNQISDSQVDQIMYSKSSLGDALMNLTQLINANVPTSNINKNYSSSYAQKLASSSFDVSNPIKDTNNNLGNSGLNLSQLSQSQNSQFKQIKDKINSVIEKIESLNNVRTNTSRNIKHIDGYCGKFYDDAKIIFKKLKILHNEKLTEITKLNYEFNRSNTGNTGTAGNITNTNSNINYNSNLSGSSLNIPNPNRSMAASKSTEYLNRNAHNTNYFSNPYNNTPSNSNSNSNMTYNKNKRRIDSISPTYKKVNTSSSNNPNSNNNLNNSNSFNIDPTNHSNHTNNNSKTSNTRSRILNNINNVRGNMNYMTSNNHKLALSSDHFSSASKNTVSGINKSKHAGNRMNTSHTNTSMNMNNISTYNSNNYNENTSSNINNTCPSTGNNFNMSNLSVKYEEIKQRNQELLEEIAKLHETYVNTQYENMRLKEESEIMKINYEEQLAHFIKDDATHNIVEDTENRIQPKPISNSRAGNVKNNTNVNAKSLTKQSLSLGKLPMAPSKTNNNANMNNVLSSSMNQSQSGNFNQSFNNTNKDKESSFPRFESLYKLSEMVIMFIRQMSNLQDAISKKSVNVKDMKKDFEIRKKELISYAKEIKVKVSVPEVSNNSNTGNNLNKSGSNFNPNRNVENINEVQNKNFLENETEKENTSGNVVKSGTKESKDYKNNKNSSVEETYPNFSSAVNTYSSNVLNEETGDIVNIVPVNSSLNVNVLPNYIVTDKSRNPDNEIDNYTGSKSNNAFNSNSNIKSGDSEKENIYNCNVITPKPCLKCVEYSKISEKNSEMISHLNQDLQQLNLEYNLEKEKFASLNQKMNQDYVTLKEENRNLNSEISNFKNLNSRQLQNISKLEEDNSKLSSDLQNLLKEISGIKTVNDSLNKKISDASSASSMKLSKLTEEINSLKNHNKNLEEEISIKNKIQENLNSTALTKEESEKKILDQLQLLQDEINKKNLQINSLNEELSKKNSSIFTLTEQNEFLIEDKNNQINIYSGKVEELKKENLKFVSLNAELEGKLNQEIANSITLNKLKNETSIKFEEKILKLEDELKKINLEIKEKNVEIVNFEKQIKSHKLIEKEYADLKEKYSNTENQNKIFTKKIEENEKEILEIKNHNANVEKENKNFSKKIEDSDKENSALKEKISSIENENKNLSKKLDETEKEVTKLNLNKDNIESQFVSARDGYNKKIAKLNEENSILMAENTKKLEKIKKLTDDINNKEKDNYEIKIEKDKLSKTIKDLNKEIENLNNINKSKVASATSDKEPDNKLLQENSTISKLTKELDILKQEKTDSENKLKSDIDLYKEEYNNISRNIRNIFDTLNLKYKDVNTISMKKSANNVNNLSKNKRSPDEAFLFDVENLEIKEELIEDSQSDNSNPLIRKNNNIEILNEINLMFLNLLSKVKTNSEEKDALIKKISELENASVSNNKLPSKDLAKLEAKLNYFQEENKRLKNLFDECTQTIYDAIASTAPNMIEEMAGKDDASDNYNPPSNNSNITPVTPSEGDFIHKAVEMFKKYNMEINEENTNLKKTVEEAEAAARRYKIMADEYKSALDIAITRTTDTHEKDRGTGNTNNGNIYMMSNPNSSMTFNKDNVNNFTVDDLVEMNVNTESDVQAANEILKVTGNNNYEDENDSQDLNSFMDEEINIKEKSKDYDKKPEEKISNLNNENTNLPNSTNTSNKLSSQKDLKFENEVKNLNEKLLEKEKEIKDLISIQDDLVNKLSIKDEELASYKDACSRLLSINNTDPKQTISLEKYRVLLDQFSKEQEQLDEMTTKYEVIKRDYEVLKSRLNAPGNTLNTIQDNESNKASSTGINNKLSIPTLNLKSMNKNSLSHVQNRNNESYEDDNSNYLENLNKSNFDKNSTNAPKQESNKNLNLNNTAAAMKKSNSLNYFGMLNDSYVKTQNSGRSKKTDNTFVQENLKDTIAKYEEHEELLQEQLMTIKKELKETREERDIYKRKFDESITLADGKKNEVLALLRQAVEKLIIEITVTPKIRELLSVVLRVLDYSEDQITQIFIMKEKNKKNFFNFFNNNK